MPVKCDICSKRFATLYNLQKHKQWVHKNNQSGDGIGQRLAKQLPLMDRITQLSQNDHHKVPKSPIPKTPFNTGPIRSSDGFPVVEAIKFDHPFTNIVSAPTNSGKTEFIKKLILNKENLIEPTPQKVIWCYSEMQPTYAELRQRGVRFVEGIPDLNELKANPEITKLLVLDDLMQEMKGDKRLTQLFTRGCHHWNVSVIHIVQNIFFEDLRTSRVNAQYIVLMKNPADSMQIQTLGRQIFPCSKHFLEAYEDSTEKPYEYLLIDLAQTTPENMRLRTNIFPDEMTMVYTKRT